MDKVIDIEERIPSMREKRRKKTNKKFLFIIAVFCIALLLLLYFQSPFSKVDSIHVKGEALHDQSYYVERSGIASGDAYWKFTTNQLEKELSSVEGVKEVTVSRKWLRDIEIEITEWDTVAYVEKEGEFSLLLANGEVFSAKSITPNVPILNNVVNKKVLKKLTSQLVKMDKNVLQLISEIIYTGEDDDADTITVYMDDGYEVHALIPAFAENMEYYPEIVTQLDGYEKGIIDMEVGTFFSPYSEVYGSEVVEEEEGEVVDEESE